MKTMDCRSVTKEINASELNQQLSAEAGAHLAGCASCRKTSEQGASLQALVASLGGAVAPGDFDMRLRARLAREKESSSVWTNFRRQLTGVPAIGLAFSLLVLVGLAIYMLPGKSQQVATDNPPAGVEVPAAVPTATQAIAGVPDPNIYPAQPQPDRRKSGSGSAGIQKPGIQSREYSSLPALSVKNSSNDPAAGSQVVSLSGPVQPVVVSMRDDNGATRRISVPPVSFGSQKLIQPSYQPVLASSKGAW